jgi:hypothetical protein
VKIVGIIQPLVVREEVVKGTTVLAIVCGVDRREMAEIGFRELAEGGLPFPGEPGSVSSTGRIPYILRNDITDEEARQMISIENEARRQRTDEKLADRMAQAKRIYKELEGQAKARRQPFNHAGAVNRICSIFSITAATWERWDVLAKLPIETQEVFSATTRRPCPLVDQLSRMDRGEHQAAITKVLEAGATSTHAVNRATEDMPQAPAAPAGGARVRTTPRGAVNKDGSRKLYPPRAEKLFAGVDLAKKQLAEIKELDYEEGLAKLVDLTNDILRFVVGEPVPSLTATKTKKERKQSPPKVAREKKQKPAKAVKAKPSEEENAEAAWQNQLSGEIDTRTEHGRAAYDRHILETLMDAKSPNQRWSLDGLTKIVGGSKSQVSGGLKRLQEKGQPIYTEGASRSLRYYVAIEESQDTQTETDPVTEPVESDGDDPPRRPLRSVEYDDDVPTGRSAAW